MNRNLLYVLCAAWPAAILWLGTAIHGAELAADHAGRPADEQPLAVAWAPDTMNGWIGRVILVALCCWLTWVWLVRVQHPRYDAARRTFGRRSASARTAGRMGQSSRKKQGLASGRDIARVGGRRAVRAKATVVRPSLAETGPIERLRVPTRDVGVELCRVGARLAWASIEDVVAVFGGPRTGKTGWLAGRVIDAPGACVVTSTRTDLLDATVKYRTRRGPVFVFNAAGVASQDSSAAFDPLVGCTDPEVPLQRTADMIPSASGDREQWAELARAALAALMHAAALGGKDMLTVRAWVAAPAKYKADIIRLLEGPASTGAFVEEARQFLETSDKTRSSITTSIMPALAWLNSDAARRAARPGTGFDVAHLLESKGTLYILGSKEQSTALMAGLAGYIAREARRIAAGGRLDPNLTLALDEAALIAPPIPDWTADMGGAGVTILACFQSRADMIERWGSGGAARILNNSRSIMLFGGTKDADDLSAWVKLFGERDERVETYDEHGHLKSATTKAVPVLSEAQLSSMPHGRVALLHRGMPPAIGRPRMVWKRRDLQVADLRVRLQAWLEARRAARLQPAAPPEVEDSTPVPASTPISVPTPEVTRAGR